ncbi:unnamed protein product [Heligmosomoides polygyrus]|uniref:Peptidylprolyl isomerase n=1 Tax=Heligmosomoides polygyrus TaxID=6339 RepID=A0A183GAV3_HELPZ|nr:unnamed protein product [Heligmosomoides polygyrus]
MTRIEEGIKTMVPGSKVRFKEMDRIKIELPKLQDKLFPIALTKLEEEKQMGFVTDFRLTYGNIEETFLRNRSLALRKRWADDISRQRFF